VEVQGILGWGLWGGATGYTATRNRMRGARGDGIEKNEMFSFITSGRWVIFYPKVGESRGKGASKFILCKSCFWLWLWMATNPFGWVVGFW
jgi:hypothetical protein